MTITIQKTLCDVTGKEVPTKVVVAPIHASMFGASEYVNQRFDLSHEGAIRVIERLLVYSNRCGEDTPKVVGRVMNNLREKVTAGQTQPYYHQVSVESEVKSVFDHPISPLEADRIKRLTEGVRKQAARECLEIVKAVLSNGDSSSRHPALLGYFITTDITKAFGL